MRDTNISNYMRIVNAVKNPIWILRQQNEKYGSGFDLWRTGENQITLELMDDCSKYGTIVDKITLDFNVDVSDVIEMSEEGWISHVSILFEKELFNRQTA